MSYRERRLARAERLREWAEKRAQRSDGHFKRAHDLVKDIPLGQPILVGHHSERRHRRVLDRSDSAMRHACEDADKGRDMASRAANIEDAVERAIYRDDPDAIERLTEKIAGLDAQRARMKAENAAYRKGDQAYATLCGITLEQAAARRVTIEAGYSWCRQPFPAYALQNLGGTLTKERKRRAELQAATTSYRAGAPDSGRGHGDSPRGTDRDRDDDHAPQSMETTAPGVERHGELRLLASPARTPRGHLVPRRDLLLGRSHGGNRRALSGHRAGTVTAGTVHLDGTR